MTTNTPKLKKEELREPFRPKFVVDDVARITKDDVNYSYKLVIYNYSRMPNNVPDHEKEGYEVVYSTEHVDDDRKFSPDNKEESALRAKPVLKRTVDGYDQVLMRIPKDLEKTNALKRSQQNDEKMVRSAKSTKRNKSGNITHVDDGEINFNNSNGDTQ